MTRSLDQDVVTIEQRVSQGRWPFRISIVMPAYEEGYGVRDVVARVCQELPEAEVIVVDDGSRDNTALEAEAGGAHVIRHPYNIGNGASIKTGVRYATGDVVLVLDADGQHDPSDIPRILDPLAQGYMMAVGARRADTHASLARRLGNGALNRFGSYVVGRPMLDLTSGFRAMRRDVLLEFLHLLPNQYSWSTTSLLAFAKAGYPVQFVPVAAQHRAGGRSRQKLMHNGIRFTLIILRIAMLFSPLRVFTPISLLFFFLSILGYLLSVLFGPSGWLHLPPSTVIFFNSAVVVFMLGLIAEQIAALRFERPPR